MNAEPKNAETRVLTGTVRFSYAHLFTPHKSAEGADPKYSVTLLIDKKDAVTVERIKTAIKAAEASGIASTWQGKKPASYKYPVVRDGDEEKPDSEGYAGMWFINASCKSKPGVVDANVQPIIDPGELKSGDYGRVTLNFYAYNQAGNKGIGCGLINVQKKADGPALGTRTSPEDDFAEDMGDVPATGPVKNPWDL